MYAVRRRRPGGSVANIYQIFRARFTPPPLRAAFARGLRVAPAAVSRASRTFSHRIYARCACFTPVLHPIYT
jgi:hypothetical protein